MHIVSGPNRKSRQYFKVEWAWGVHLLTYPLPFQLAGLTLISSLQRVKQWLYIKNNVCIWDEIKSGMRHDAEPSEQVTAREQEQSQLIFGSVHSIVFIAIRFLPFLFRQKSK